MRQGMRWTGDYTTRSRPVKANVIILSPPAEMTGWKVTVTAQGKADLLAQQAGPFPFNPAGETMDVPDLPEGQYTLTATLTGRTGRSRPPGPT